MHIRNPKKFGVLGVLGVPESLQPFNGKAFSLGTQSVKVRNTGVPEHQWCSSTLPRYRNTEQVIERLQPRKTRNTTQRLFLPAGRSLQVRCQQSSWGFGAVIHVAHWGDGEI